ncbi:MAG: FAD binding domain-containing protein [Deltaproteobacteria bacterium]|nr:FAD binding domain-containing protein [Deltaproteobacteria bacterium]
MHLKPFAYHRPLSLAGLWDIMDKAPSGGFILLGGGTDVLPRMGQRLLAPAALIGLKNIAELKVIEREGDDVFIGAASALQHVRESELVSRLFPALAQAAARVGSPQLRHMGTIGGNLCLDTRCLYYNQRQGPGAFPRCYKKGGDRCHVVKGGKRCYALFSADTPAALLALDARVCIGGAAGKREAPLNEFYRDDGIRSRDIGEKEIVLGIKIPGKPVRVSAYLRFSTRAAIDFPLAGLAVSVEKSRSGAFVNPRVAATGICSRPLRLAGLETLLAGRDVRREITEEEWGDALKELRPVRHQGISPAYRKYLFGVLMQRARARLVP